RAPPLCDCVWLCGKGPAGGAPPGDARKIQRQPAPAASDVQQFLTGLQAQLGGQMQFLVGLGGLQIVVVAAEIGAAVLPVLVEEEVIERAREVVVMGDVAPRPADRV